VVLSFDVLIGVWITRINERAKEMGWSWRLGSDGEKEEVAA